MTGNIDTFLAMGGYAGFVWPAYGVAIAVLGGVVAVSWRRYRDSIGTLDRLQQDLGRRR
jgi:heme exporter protein D